MSSTFFYLFLLGVCFLTFREALRLGRTKGCWGLLPPVLGYFLHYHLSGSDPEFGKPTLFLILAMNAGCSLGCLAILLRRASLLQPVRTKALIFFVLAYLASFPLSYSHGTALREFVVSGSFVVTGTLAGLVAAGPDFRRMAYVVVAGCLVSSVLSLFFSGVWAFGDEAAYFYAPIGLEGFKLERRIGFFPSVSFEAALICLGFVAATSWRVMMGNEKLFRLVQAGVFGFVAGFYLLMSQFRVLILATGMVAFAGAVAVARRHKWLISFLVLGGFIIVLQLGAIVGLLQVPFLSREQLSQYEGRVEINRRSMQLFELSPFYGNGFASNGTLFQQLGLEIFNDENQPISGSHSAHIIILTELGLIGTAVWAWLWVMTLRDGYRRFSIKPAEGIGQYENHVLFFVAVAVVSAQIFHGFLYDPLVWMVLGWQYPELATVRQPVRKQPVLVPRLEAFPDPKHLFPMH